MVAGVISSAVSIPFYKYKRVQLSTHIDYLGPILSLSNLPLSGPEYL